MDEIKKGNRQGRTRYLSENLHNPLKLNLAVVVSHRPSIAQAITNKHNAGLLQVTLEPEGG